MKRAIQKKAEATRDLVGNKIDKIGTHDGASKLKTPPQTGKKSIGVPVGMPKGL